MNKLVSLSLAALVATAGAASAANNFTFDRGQSTTQSITLTGVEADQTGRFLVFERDDSRASGLGRVLGAAPIEVGATDSVTIPLTRAAADRVVVVMYNDNYSIAKFTSDPLSE
jgi:hypothetical protein